MMATSMELSSTTNHSTAHKDDKNNNEDAKSFFSVTAASVDDVNKIFRG